MTQPLGLIANEQEKKLKNKNKKERKKERKKESVRFFFIFFSLHSCYKKSNNNDTKKIKLLASLFLT